jgi:hypothetical protein
MMPASDSTCALVGDHADGFVHRHGVAVEQLELFAGPLAPAHFQTAMDLVEIEDVRRAAVFEHHVVRDVDQGGHAALATARQAVHHPGRRGGTGVDVAHNRARRSGRTGRAH